MLQYERIIAEINLDNIAHNVKQICKQTNKNTMVMAIVKADAYGHGSLEVSKTCLYNGASCLGVATCDEGVYLRKNNIFEPILLLGHTIYSKFEDVINYNLTQTIFSYETAKVLSDYATKLAKEVSIHIKIDTGMGRLGFFPSDKSLQEIILISKLPFLKITGVFTHFASSDAEDKSFAMEQFNKFKIFVDKIKKSGINNIVTHCSNSGAILDLKEFNLDMVRAGIIIYGVYPSDEIKNKINLLPAMSLKTHISLIKEFPPNTSVGYSRTYFTNKVTKIATIPVGYADGYARIMSNKANVIIRGQFAPVIGSICMDQMMVDVTHIENVHINDTVTLLGEQNSSKITADDLANLQQTISYEVFCSIGKRVPRVYIKNGQFLKTVCY